MVAGHREVKTMLTDRTNQAPAAKGTTGSGSDDARLDSAVNGWANKALPVVSHHLQQSEQINGRTK